ncbi:small ribosomal subunit protein eS19-like [Bolinopsis microptera]|uniref:small ribosomal subunit protein eS19-like n=1 Tax=Bolinopsis microptera TaxID=2820187 RepID=UPI003079CD65
MASYQSLGPIKEHIYKEKHTGGVTLKDVESHMWVKEFAAFLKKSGKLTIPKWTDIVKTATFKELPPKDNDWYYIRSAALLRRVYLRQGVGTGSLRKIYGGRINRGSAPSHHKNASASVIRHALKGLVEMKLIANHPDGGRMITSAGRRDADRIASQVMSASQVAVEEAEEEVAIVAEE